MQHSASQDWMKENYNARDGQRNLTNLVLAIGNDNVIINTLQVNMDQHDGARPLNRRLPIQHVKNHQYSMANIEEVSKDNDQAFV